MLSRTETIRQLLERCPTETIHRIAGLVSSAVEVFEWAEDHNLREADVVERIIELHALSTKPKTVPKEQLYGQRRPSIWEPGLDRERMRFK